MGVKCAIYRAAAAGIGPGVPDAQREVCHRGGRPGDNKAKHPQRAHKTVSRHPYRAFFCTSLAFSAFDYLCEMDKLARGHSRRALICTTSSTPSDM